MTIQEQIGKAGEKELKKLISDFTPYSITDCKNLSEFIYLQTSLYSQVIEIDDWPCIQIQTEIENLFWQWKDIFIELDNDLTFMGYSDLMEKLNKYLMMAEIYREKNYLSLNQ